MSERIGADVRAKRRRGIGFATIPAAVLAALAVMVGGTWTASGAAPKDANPYQAGSASTRSLTTQQRAALYGIARDTWRF